MPQDYYAYIKTVDRRTGLAQVTPVNMGPDQGLPGSGGGDPGTPDQGFNPNYPDQSLPGATRPGGRPGHFPSHERPTDPGFGRPGGNRPGHLPSRPGDRPPWGGAGVGTWPPGPTDPDYGIDGGIGGGLTPTPPIFIPDVGPGHDLPPVSGEQPPTDPPPGTIWPPLPEDAPVGKHAFLFYIQGVGFRWGVLEVPPHKAPKA